MRSVHTVVLSARYMDIHCCTTMDKLCWELRTAVTALSVPLSVARTKKW